MKSKTHIVIMAGGIGSRLFPLSTPEHPKQFLDLLGTGRTMIQMTYARFLEVDPEAEFWVVTSRQYAGFVREQLPEIPESHVLCEPEPRNTTPCIAYAAWKIAAETPEDQNPCIIVTPSDAYVPDTSEFALTMRAALAFAAENHSIICSGISPDRPETNYGYIYCENVPAGKNVISRVTAFKEKPDLETAAKYLQSGSYFWNAGIFIFNLETVISELRTHAALTAEYMDELSPSLFGPEEDSELARIFPLCEKISFDYSVMEVCDCVYMVPGNWFWSDVGGFEALSKITGKKY